MCDCGSWRGLYQRDRQLGARQLTVRYPRPGSARACSQSHGDQETMTWPAAQVERPADEQPPTADGCLWQEGWPCRPGSSSQPWPGRNMGPLAVFTRCSPWSYAALGKCQAVSGSTGMNRESM